MANSKKQLAFIRKLKPHQRFQLAMNIMKLDKGMKGEGVFGDIAKKFHPSIMKHLIEKMERNKIIQVLNVGKHKVLNEVKKDIAPIKNIVKKFRKGKRELAKQIQRDITGHSGKGLRLAGQRGRGIPKKFKDFAKRFPSEVKDIVKSISEQAGSGSLSRAIGALGLVGATAAATGLALREYLIRNPQQIAKLAGSAAKLALQGSGAGESAIDSRDRPGVLNPSGSGLFAAGAGHPGRGLLLAGRGISIGSNLCCGKKHAAMSSQLLVINTPYRKKINHF